VKDSYQRRQNLLCWHRARNISKRRISALNPPREEYSSLGIRPGNIPGSEAPGVSVTAELLHTANYKPTELVVT
jgi:hypothetical protein